MEISRGDSMAREKRLQILLDKMPTENFKLYLEMAYEMGYIDGLEKALKSIRSIRKED